MKAELTAIMKRDTDWWLGWVEEVPGANAQERTREELMESLREAAQDILALRCMEAKALAESKGYDRFFGWHEGVSNTSLNGQWAK